MVAVDMITIVTVALSAVGVTWLFIGYGRHLERGDVHGEDIESLRGELNELGGDVDTLHEKVDDVSDDMGTAFRKIDYALEVIHDEVKEGKPCDSEGCYWCYDTTDNAGGESSPD